MNVFRFEFKQLIRSTLSWSLALGLVVIIFMSFYPVYYEQIAIMKPLFDNLPELLLKSLGVNVDTLFTGLGFYSFILMYIQLIAAMQAMMIGLGVVGKEVRLKMNDFILTKPMSRSSILIQKSLAIFSHLLITWIFLSGLSWVMLNSVETGPLNYQVFILFTLSTLLLQVMFASVGLLTAVLLRKLKSVVGVSMSVVFTLFVMNLMQAILDEPWLRYLSPFQWFEKSYIFYNSSFEWPMLAMCALISIGSCAGAYVVYIRKDIHAV